jgi:hypothetical protein
VGERRVGIVDRLVLADHAAQTLRDRPRACLQRRIFQDFVGRHRECGRRQRHEQENEREAPHDHSAGASAGFRRRFGRADAQPPVGERQRPAEHHDNGTEPDQQHQRLVIEADSDRAVGIGVADQRVKAELGDHFVAPSCQRPDFFSASTTSFGI